MLRESIKHGISEALSGRAGFDVWDFDLKQSKKETQVKLEIRYRYQPELVFRATLKPDVEALLGIEVVEDERGGESYTVSDPEECCLAIEVQCLPGELFAEEESVVEGLSGLYDAIDIWVGRVDCELEAVAANRVRMAQQRALAELGQTVANVPDRRPAPERVRMLHSRLDDLEFKVLQLRGHTDPTGKADATEEADAIREEFDSLRRRLASFSERSFFQALLVRLVKYFWDENTLRLIDSARDAAASIIEDRGSVAPAPSRLRAAGGVMTPNA